MCIIYHLPQYGCSVRRQSGLLQENGFFCRGATIRRIEGWKDRKQKRRGLIQRDISIIPTQPIPKNQLRFFAAVCLLSAPLPPCWPDKGSSLHQRPPRISHLFYRKGRALASSSVHAGESSFLLFISQVRDDPRAECHASLPPIWPPNPLHHPSHHLGLASKRDSGERSRWRTSSGFHNTSRQSGHQITPESRSNSGKLSWWRCSIWAMGWSGYLPAPLAPEQASREMRSRDKRVSTWQPSETFFLYLLKNPKIAYNLHTSLPRVPPQVCVCEFMLSCLQLYVCNAAVVTVPKRL